ncbi:MAG TPA: Pls/PosA family non-ribosomal peptide synthetase [Geodermatophilus sp.]|nr:Pls/PosA family non-ribosomal peptide synthetase [Geodermatophilus sp.]
MVGEPAGLLTADPTRSPATQPRHGTETLLAQVLAEVVHLDRVPVDSHFFDDLCADSMVMAQFCARVRKRDDLPSVSIKDIYQHPTIRSLATALTEATATPLERALTEVLADVLHTERVPVEAHFFDDLGADSMVMTQFCARVRKRDDLPSVSIKDVYQHPSLRSLAGALAPPSPAPVEGALTEILADLLGAGQVTADSHFFDDLGADSMVMAQFCARVRKRDDLPSVSIKDIYRYPTISSLTAALAEAAPAPSAQTATTPTSVDPSGPAPVDVASPAGTPQFVLCGVLQALVFLGYSYLAAIVAVRGFDWISEGGSLLAEYLRAVAFGGLVFVGMSVIPIVAKWTLIGRWQPQRIRIWSLAYVRFWVVKTLVRSSPLAWFVGSPLYTFYLRTLGAQIGRRVAIFTRHLPIGTDLLTVGDGTIIRKEAAIPGYRAQAGFIEIGAVTIGKNAVVSEATVLDIDTSIGDGAQLGMRSSLHAGQAVPAGQRWHGSPAVPTEVDYRMVEPTDCGTRRRVVYSVLQVVNLLTVTLPMGMGGLALLYFVFPEIGALLDPGPLALTSWSFYRDVLEISAAVFFGGILLSAAVTFTVPRVLNRFIEPDRVYPLYGFHYVVQKLITRFTNRKFLTAIFGDSSYIVHYLRLLGYDLSRVVQTGSNFGTNVTQETPYLVTVGSGTMIADGITFINADFSNTSFRVSRATVGTRSFYGNGIIYPSQARTGDNCLLATKVLVPIEGPMREGVGLLGSPAFEIPRSVERDAMFDHYKSESELAGRLAAKNRYNLRTMALFVTARWLNFVGLTLMALAAAELHADWGAEALLAAELGGLAFTITYGVLVERANLRFGRLQPQFCSIYDPYFWWHERYWKLLWNPAFFNGTPLKGPMWRLVGVRVGRRLFDDGCDIPERTLVTIGDDCTLNALTWLQCHSQEDGTFKSDYATIGNGCTIALSAWTHYGVTLGDGAVLAPDAFLMKGEEVPPGATWAGNPAAELRAAVPALPVGAARSNGHRPALAGSQDAR